MKDQLTENMLDIALSVATRAHFGQKDKAGQPYILHPLKLLHKFRDENERIVAVLHDVVEDSDVTLEQLRNLGFAEVVVDAVDCLTKRSGEGYEDFITRISSNSLAKKIKIEDIRENMDLSRLPKIDERDLERVKKYHEALNKLLTSQ